MVRSSSLARRGPCLRRVSSMIDETRRLHPTSCDPRRNLPRACHQVAGYTLCVVQWRESSGLGGVAVGAWHLTFGAGFQYIPIFRPIFRGRATNIQDQDLERSKSIFLEILSPASMARSERRMRHGPRSWAGVIHASSRALAVACPTLYVISKPSTVTSTMGSTKYLPPTVGVDGVSRYLAVHDESRLFVTYCVLSSEILF